MKFEYQIGDIVHAHYQSLDMDGIIIELLPKVKWGGEQSLYRVLFDKPLPTILGLCEVQDNRHSCTFHGMFLSLVEATDEETGMEISVQGLL